MAAVETAPRPEAAGALQFGRVFKTTFGAIGRNWLTLAVISLLFGVIPNISIDLAHAWLVHSSRVWGPLTAVVCGMAARMVPATLLYSAGALIVSSDVEGKRSHVGKVIVGIAAAFPRVLATYVCYEIAVVFGFLLLIVPGVIMVLAWEAALPSAVLERRSAIDALRRSADLTRSRRGAILGLLLAYSAPFVALAIAGRPIVGAFGLSTAAYQWPMVVFRAADGFFAQPFGIVITAVLYFELCRLKEGILPAEAAVFD